MGMFDKSIDAGNQAVKTKKEKDQLIAPEMNAQLFTLETAKIHPDPNQPRKEWLPDELEELIATIEETNGCHTPIKVRPHPEITGEYMIIYGEGRWLSHNHLKYATIPALLDTSEKTPYQISFEQLTENLSRKSMTRFDEATAIKKLMDEHEPKLKQNQVAKKLGKPTSFVSRLLKLIKAPESIKDLSRNGITQNINVLDSLFRISEIISEEELQNYVDSVVSGSISEIELLQALNDFKRATEEPAREEEQTTMFEERGGSNSVTDPLSDSESYSDSNSGSDDSDNETGFESTTYTDDDSTDSHQSDTGNQQEIAELQFLEMTSYEVFAEHVILQTTDSKITVKVTRAELKEILEAEL